MERREGKREKDIEGMKREGKRTRRIGRTFSSMARRISK